MIHHELKTFVEMDKGTHEYANILISICKNIGEDIFGFIPSRLRGVFKVFKTLSKVERVTKRYKIAGYSFCPRSGS